jgi:uncharacterized Zn-binding protein involved in type VI secretion
LLPYCVELFRAPQGGTDNKQTKDRDGRRAQSDGRSRGGTGLEGSLTDICTGKPIAVVGHKTTCHELGGTYPIFEDVLTTACYGQGVPVAGMKTACGAVLDSQPIHTDQVRFFEYYFHNQNWRPPMTSTSFLKVAFACATTMVAPVAAAQVSDVDLLTCNIAKAVQSLPSAWDRLHPRESPNGTFVVPGPVREQGLCIQNATIAAAFGAFTVTAELCNSTAQPLLDWLVKNRASLQRITGKNQPGIIAVFGNEKDTLSVFYGRASPQSKPDPTNQEISFFCGVAGSGPQ